MNRHDRRAAEARNRKPLTRAEIINLGLQFLAASGNTATGATLIHPDGSTTYVSRETADAMTGAGKAEGDSQ